MKLKVWLPISVLLDETVTKIKAEAENGHFCLLPHHIDFVTALVPGSYRLFPPPETRNISPSITPSSSSAAPTYPCPRAARCVRRSWRR